MTERLRFSDLSAGDRIGFKGPESSNWLSSRIAGLPSQPNRLTSIEPGIVIGRLSSSEYSILALAVAGSGLVAGLRADWDAKTPAGCYVVPRFHSQALFGLEGEVIFDLLAKMSPVDFRERTFPVGAIAQTTCAKAVVQLYCLARAPQPRVLIAVDSTLATHLADCVADAMSEYR
jgi:sarcosine oxidase subunit gamma